MLQEPSYIQLIAEKLNLNEKQVKAVLELTAEGATVPFIARYRKEKTGNLDESQIREILDLKKKEENLYQAKQTALNGIKEKGKLTPELEKNIIQAKTLKEVEEIYKPYKSKRKTKAMIAEEKGLKPVSKRLQKIGSEDYQKIKNNLKNWLKENLKPEEWEKIKDLDEKEILEGAFEILSAEIVENTKLRDFLRNELLNYSNVVSKIKSDKMIEKLPENVKSELYKFDIYKDFSTSIKKIKSYQILAINRGEKLGILNKKLEAQDENLEEKFYKEQEKLFGYNFKSSSDLFGVTLPTSPYKKLFESVENEVFSMLKEKAEDDGIKIFQSNLFELLMTRPNYEKRILAIDPGYRTGCKLVVLDKGGNPEKFDKIYLHKEDEAKTILKQYLNDVDVIVVGNGTASNETVELLQSITDKDIYIVNESGASVYSASKTAQEEFPELDLTDRGTVSIGRRYIDPLSELVKIPVGSIGVGMYQHDMPEKKLEEKLGYVVEDVVNQVGVNVNTASWHVLKNISGIDTRTAKKIYKNRPYASRQDLKKLLSDKVYQQAIGFLRVPNSPEILDNTDIHPEQYELVSGLQDLLGLQDKKDLINYFQNKFDNEIENLAKKIFSEHKEKLQKLYEDVNVETIKFIFKSLKNAGKDPRVNSAHQKAGKKVSIDELKEGDILEGVVRNILQFGVFVDVGLKNDGLVHISEIANEFVADPADFVQVGQKVKVKVIGIDKEKNKVQLSMKEAN